MAQVYRQMSLGLVASPLRPLSPSRREMLRRTGRTLSIQQERSLRRALRADEAAHMSTKVDRTTNRGLRSLASILEEAITMPSACPPQPEMGRKHAATDLYNSIRLRGGGCDAR